MQKNPQEQTAQFEQARQPEQIKQPEQNSVDSESAKKSNKEGFASTGKFTSYDQSTLRASMGKVEGVGVVATVNEDGTANAAIFVPLMPDDDHVVLIIAKNRTRTNIERTGECVLVYDVVDWSAAEKSAQHQGARLRLELLREGETEYDQVKNAWSRMNSATLIFRITEFMPVG